MQVKAAPGLQVPLERDPRRYIDDSATVEVPHTHYYVRRLADGDLVEQRAEPEAPAKPATRRAAQG